MKARGKGDLEWGGGVQRRGGWDERDFAWGNDTHDAVGRWSFIELYTRELYGFVTNVTPINLIKKTN